MVTANCADRLIQHYVDNFRRLPWRSPPGAPAQQAYPVWLSEIMLQQTVVATVIPRFERFVERWPTIEALAAASDEEILSEWAGLGYYARARNLIACAREVVRRGAFPTTAAELRKLPGIGEYTSAAIAAIAFGEPVAAIDTNVARVVGRFHGLEHSDDRSRDEVRKLAATMMPVGRPGDWAQATMDLGATICRPRSPKCSECPLNSGCAAFASGEPERFARRQQRKPRPRKYGVAYWTELRGHVWLVRRPSKGLLGGMAALPGSDWEERPVQGNGALGTVRHVFTHFTLDLVVEARPDRVGEGWWQPLDRLDQAGLPTLYRRAADVALEARLPTRAAA
jgi:A/G-specific adenine glycosylase